MVTFAYITGWRMRSEIWPLQWSLVDFKAGIVRLDPGTTKNDKGRVFPIREFKRSWKTACKDAGTPGRIPHDFRRTAVRNLV